MVMLSNVQQARSDFTQLQFTDCGSTAIILDRVDITPMPIVRPSTGNLTFNINIKRPISKRYRHVVEEHESKG